MDVSNAIIAKSDQLNAIDLVGGEVTATIVEVKPGPQDQPIHVVTDIFGPARPWKPSKTALRDIVQAWGTDSTVWVGRRITLFNDPEVLWAGQKVGGVRVRAMSHIDKPFEATHIITRGKSKKVMIQPLTTDPVQVQKAVAAIRNAATIPELDKIGAHADKVGISSEVRDAIDTRRADLEAPNQADG